MSVRAGGYDRRIRIEQATETQESTGQPIPTWGLFAEVWARKLDTMSGKRFTASQKLPELTAVFFIRWRAGVTQAMRIVYAGTVYEITGLAEVGRREEWEITATAKPMPGGDA